MVLRKRPRVSGLGVWTIAQLGDFYALNRNEFHSHANRLLKDSGRADEITQDALVRVLLASPELESKEHAIAYMHRTIENLCIDVFRREGKRPNLVALDEAYLEVETIWQTEADLADKISVAEDAAIVREALSLLSHSERAALVMWELEGRSSKEIARELGIRESSVRHTVSRARKALRRILAERVIDESTGVTALDLLAKSYKKVSEVSEKTSRVALSLLLLLFAVFGLDSILGRESIQTPAEEVYQANAGAQSNVVTVIGMENKLMSDGGESAAPVSPSIGKVEKSKKDNLWFKGLSKKGMPTGFTVADSSGGFGQAYFSSRSPLFGNPEQTIGQIIKTESGASNLLIAQSIATEPNRLEYRPVISYGRDGVWVPLQVRVTSTSVEPTEDGNYLVTAYIAVESPLEALVEIATSSKGRDLAVEPSQVITRLTLDSSKTQILNQAVFVVEKWDSQLDRLQN